MKIDLLLTGKTTTAWIKAGIDEYRDRLRHYTDFTIREVNIPSGVTSLPSGRQTEEECKLLLKQLNGYDVVILLDEKGAEMSSAGFAGFLQRYMNRGSRKIAFVAGGAYGFSGDFYSRFSERISMSKMTFSHQMIRLFFTEQLYRAFTILRGESYHHG